MSVERVRLYLWLSTLFLIVQGCGLFIGGWPAFEHIQYISSISWSPDNKRIGFLYEYIDKEISQLQHVVYTINIDGSDLTQISIHKPFFAGLGSHCEWSPDGNHFLFSSNKEGKIFTLSLGGILKTITNRSDEFSYASYSPDMRYILVSSGCYGPDCKQYIIDLHTNQKLSITFDTAVDDLKGPFKPVIAWSHTSKMVYVTNIININYKKDDEKPYTIFHGYADFTPEKAEVTQLKIFKQYKHSDKLSSIFESNLEFFGWSSPNSIVYLSRSIYYNDKDSEQQLKDIEQQLFEYNIQTQKTEFIGTVQKRTPNSLFYRTYYFPTKLKQFSNDLTKFAYIDGGVLVVSDILNQKTEKILNYIQELPKGGTVSIF